MPNRKGLIVYSFGALALIVGFQFLVSLWAAREAAEGEHTAVAAAVLTAI